jgi:hypothetical protein
MAILCSGKGVTESGGSVCRGAIWTQLAEENLLAAVHTLPKIHAKTAPMTPSAPMTKPLNRNSRLLTLVVIRLSLVRKFPDRVDETPDLINRDLAGEGMHGGSRNSVANGRRNPFISERAEIGPICQVPWSGQVRKV